MIHKKWGLFKYTPKWLGDGSCPWTHPKASHLYLSITVSLQSHQISDQQQNLLASILLFSLLLLITLCKSSRKTSYSMWNKSAVTFHAIYTHALQSSSDIPWLCPGLTLQVFRIYLLAVAGNCCEETVWTGVNIEITSQSFCHSVKA